MDENSESATESLLIVPNSFIVAGISITTLRKDLKPALPKKRQENSSIVVITSRASSVTISITGAAVEMPAITSGAFVAELPFLKFKYLLTEPFKAGSLIEFKFAAGAFSVGELTIRSPEIVIAPQKADNDSDWEQDSPAVAAPSIVDPLDAPMGAPLLSAYKYIRKFGIQPSIVSKTFVRQQYEVDKTLKQCDRMLQPLGLTRADLERMLDQKAGLS